jgi:ribonuclease Z
MNHNGGIRLVELRIIFLGTSSAVPTIDRGLSSIAIVRDGEILLFDAGEGVQRSFSMAKLGLNRKMKIFITHLHGDHCVGLLGIIQTMSKVDRDKPLIIYGPKGIKGFIKGNIRSLKFSVTFPIYFEVVKDGSIIDEKDYFVKVCRGKHHITNLAYVLEEKDRPGLFHPEAARKLNIKEGKLWSNLQKGESVRVNDVLIHPNQVLGPRRAGRKIAISGDTRPTLRIQRFIQDSDVAILDSTYFDDHLDKAKANLHMTAKEAALLAKKARVKQLVLTHFSSRYKDISPYLPKIRKIHPNVLPATDFMVLEVSYPSK